MPWVGAVPMISPGERDEGVGEDAAAREFAEELGSGAAAPRPVVTYVCRSGLSPYWLGLHEVLVTGALAPDPAEIAWYGWLTEAAMCEAVCRADFVPDGREAFDRYRAAGQAGRTTPWTGMVKMDSTRTEAPGLGAWIIMPLPM